MRRGLLLLLLGLTAADLAGQDRRSALVSAIPGPRYPEVLQAAGLPGTVSMRLDLFPDGTLDTSGIRVLASPHPLFAKSATAAVRGWRFRGALVGGQEVPGSVLIDVVFALGRGAGMHTFDRMDLKVDSVAGPKWVVTSSPIDFTGRGRRPADSTWRRVGIQAVATLLASSKWVPGATAACVEWPTPLSAEELRPLLPAERVEVVLRRCSDADDSTRIRVREVGVWEGRWTKVLLDVGRRGNGQYHECLIDALDPTQAMECRARPAGWVS